MRPHIAHLLLLCSLLTTSAAQLKCDRSLIKGATDAEIHFDTATKRLTCVRKENNLMMIHLNVPAKDEIYSLPHEFISCDEANGWNTERMLIYWTTTEYGEHKIADASSPLNISCVEYCASSGAALRYKKDERNNEGQSFDDGPITLLHADSTDEKCDIHYGWRKVDLPISCNPYNGWHDKTGYLLTSESKVPLRVECIRKDDAPPPCTLLPENGDFETFNVDLQTRMLSCHSSDQVPKAIVFTLGQTEKRYDALMCTGKVWLANVTSLLDNEWTTFPLVIAKASTPLRIYQLNVDAISFELMTFLRCRSNSPPHAVLTCDRAEGWRTRKITPMYGTNKDDPRYEAHKIAEAYTPLNVECVEYCASTGSGFDVNPKAVDDNDKYSLLDVYVADVDECDLYYDWRSTNDYAYCSPYDGWYVMHSRDQELLTREVRVAQPFIGTCRGEPLPPCIVQLKGYNHHHFLELNVDIATRTLTCRDKLNSFADIKFNSKRYPSLQCDETRGWTSKLERLEDGSLISKEERVPDASSKLEIDCDPICEVSGAGIIFSKNGENAEVSCAGGHKLFFGETYVTSAKCSPKNGTWTMFTEASRDFQVRLKVDLDCRPICPEPVSTEAHFDKATKTLTCDSADDSLVAIEFNSDLYTSLTCDDFGGWKGIVHENKRRNLAPTSALINYTCVKYCTTAGRGMSFNVSDEKIKISVKCKQEGARLIYDAKPIDDVVCDLQSGWQSKGVKFSGDTTTPLDVYCEAPRTTGEDPLSETSTSGAAQAQSASSVVIGSAIGVVLAIIAAAAVVLFVVLRKRKRQANSEKGADGKAGKKENEKSDANVVSSG